MQVMTPEELTKGYIELREEMESLQRSFKDRREFIHQMNQHLQNLALAQASHGAKLTELSATMSAHNEICAAQKKEFKIMFELMQRVEAEYKLRKQLRTWAFSALGTVVVILQILIMTKDLVL